MIMLFKSYVLVILLQRCNGAVITSCGLDQYTVTDSNNTIRCMNCAVCAEGHGTVPQCGAFLRRDVSVECHACVVGRSYSHSHDVASCMPCTVCVEKEYVTKKCTPTSNTECGKCKPGHYRSIVHSCEKCSPCCEDTQKEDLEKQCLAQGFPTNRACRYTDRKCRKVGGSSSAENKSKAQNEDVQFNKWHVYVVGAVLASLASLAMLLIFILVLCFSRKTTMASRKQPSQQQSWQRAEEYQDLWNPSHVQQKA